MKARIALSKSFLRAQAELPKAIAKKTREFLTKFERDPTSPGLNFERIAGAADPNVRSLRIDQSYRAIVVHPPKGDVYVCVWVAHHDAAYAWAAHRRFGVNPAQGSFQVVDLAGATGAAAAGERAPQAATGPEGPRLFDAFPDATLLAIGVPEILLPTVRGLRDDAHFEQLVPHLPEDAAEMLTYLAAGYSVDEALDELAAAPPVEPIDVEDFAAALARPASAKSFAVVAGPQELGEILDAPLDQWRVFLHPSQRQVVRMHAKGPVRVLGGAGTGKTVALLHRVKVLLERRPAARVFVTTFTRNLAADLEQQLGTLLGSRVPNVTVQNLDGWASQLLRDRGVAARPAQDAQLEEFWELSAGLSRDPSLDRHFFAEEWEHVIEAQGIEARADYLRASRAGRGRRLGRAQRIAAWEVLEDFAERLDQARLVTRAGLLDRVRRLVPADPPFDHVLADEVQDLSGSALRLLRALAPPGDDDLFLVGDGHQRIYGRPLAMSDFGIQVRGRSRRLKLNYRTTDQIRAQAIRALGDRAFDDLDGGQDAVAGYRSLRAGPVPVVRCFPTEAQELEALVETLTSWAELAPLEEICIAARTHRALETRYLPALHAVGIETYELGPDVDDRSRSGVRVATMHRLKGLEFARMVLVGVQRGQVPLALDSIAEPELHERQERSLLYVAATRARDELVVLGYGEPSPLLAL